MEKNEIEMEVIFSGDPGFLDWAELFDSRNPVEFEVGFGKGRFLLESARANPDICYFGIERSHKWFRNARRRMMKTPLANLRICQCEALDFISRKIPSASLQVIHLYHPDPWPKKRHNKRRMMAPPFLDQVARCLVPGGLLLVTTDHREYSLVIDQLLEEDRRLTQEPWAEGTDPNTHFEAKYRREGRNIYQYRYRLHGGE
jgi:tRNA (guanine-N7-)-methyltransferase